jgi:hypothetical protein
MGLRDRDYMRDSGEDPPPHAPADEKVEAFLEGFLTRHRRLLVIVGVVFGLLITLGIILAFFDR